jgi:hypothetical protein
VGSPLQPRFGEVASAKKKFWASSLDLPQDVEHFQQHFKLSKVLSKMADKIEKAKKRKRSTDGSSKSSKRVAIEGDNQVKISVHEVDKWAPIIGMFIIQRLLSC